MQPSEKPITGARPLGIADAPRDTGPVMVSGVDAYRVRSLGNGLGGVISYGVTVGRRDAEVSELEQNQQDEREDKR